MDWPAGGRASIMCSMHANDDREVLARRRAALGLAAVVGCDARTAARALEHGVEAIRPLRLRAELRNQIARMRADLRASSAEQRDAR